MKNKKSLLNNRYQMIEKIGQGGNAITYLADDKHNQENVVIKVLSIKQLDNWDKLKLFEREADILQQLNHPAIPKYIDYFDEKTESDYSFYLVQQLAPGKSLFTLIEEGWQPDEETVKNIAQQVLEILTYLQYYSPPVIHRDIKPHNLIYCFPEDINREQGKVFLVDFGAVQDTYRHTITNSLVAGTPGYMAPEQMCGKTSLSTDLYGLGKTLLFLLTGQSPEELPSRKRKINVRSLVNISPQFAEWIEYLIEPKMSQRCPNAQTALDILLERQIPKVRQPANTSIRIMKNDESFNIYIPPAITRKKSNLIIGYLGLSWNVLLMLFILRLFEFYVFSIFQSSSLFISIPLILCASISMLCMISLMFFHLYRKNKLDYSLIIMTLVVSFMYWISSQNIPSSIIILVTGILLNISEYYWGNPFRKGSLNDLLFKKQINIYRDTIYLSTYFFNHLVDIVGGEKEDLKKIIANHSIILEYYHRRSTINIKSYYLGLLLTKQEKKWLVSEINNNLY